MHDKNYNGSIDLDECVTLLYARFGKVLRMPASRPVPFAPPSPSTRHSPPASRLPPPAVGPRPWPLVWLPATLLASPSSRPRTCPRRAVAGGGRQARARNVRPVRHREEHLLLQVRHRRAPPRPAGTTAPLPLHWNAP